MVREDAAQMCALQMQAEAGPTMLESPESLETAIERFIHKQVRNHHFSMIQSILNDSII